MVQQMYETSIAKRSLSPAARTATANGVAVDKNIAGGAADAIVVIATGTITDGTHTISIEDSADGSTGWAAVPAAQLQGTVPVIGAADDDKVFEVGVIDSKQFLRVTSTLSGAPVTGGVYGAVIVLGDLRTTPVSHA